MYTQSTQQTYKRQYPPYKTVRIRNSNLEKIKSKATKYGQSIDDIITDILDQLETGTGYAAPEDQRSWWQNSNHNHNKKATKSPTKYLTKV
jgi:xanthine dehydrogenase molybdopterin-binding subunit B